MPRNRTPRTLLALCLLLLATEGCAGGGSEPAPAAQSVSGRRAISVVGVFDDYNEVLRGKGMVDNDLHVHFLDFKGLVSGIRCVGHGRLTHVGERTRWNRTCDAVVGVSTVTCSDGRQVELQYELEPDCRSAHGAGKDQYGNLLSFVYGLDLDAAEKSVRAELRRSSARPPLPVYDPSEVRSQQGFSTGTGWFVSDAGHLVTSEHVVAGSTRIRVLDAEGVEHEVEYLAGDVDNDVALLRVVDLRGEPLKLRRAGSMRKGEEVFALGYPLIQLQGQEQKATFGRVNALSGAEGDTRFLQVDVPIQPGNSGGPLLDMKGQVVGVVTATLDQVVSFRAAGVIPQNVNYAIRSDYVLDLLSAHLPAVAAESKGAAEVAPEDLVEKVEGSVVLLVAR
ncbi:MAG: S1C family serine protease [Myxococcota bacterium]